MSTTVDDPPPDAFEPVLPISPRPYRSIGRRLIGPICFVAVLGGLFVLWFALHRHMAAMTAISMQGGDVHWNLSQGRWMHGGESSVSYGPGGRPVEEDAITPLPDLNHLVSLDLSNRLDLSPPSYDVLTRLPDLQYLYLSNNPVKILMPGAVVNDAGLSNIANHPRLVELYLDGNPITDAGLASLSGLPRLEIIDLSRTNVTDAGLKRLLSLPNLKLIHVEETKVTAEGIDAFVRLRPEVEIIRTESNADPN